MKPYGSKWATRKYPGSMKVHSRMCTICYPPEKISVIKSRERQTEKYQILEAVMQDEDYENVQQDAYAVIADKLILIKQLLLECEKLATESEVTFYLDLGQSNYFDGENGIWQSSSSNC